MMEDSYVETKVEALEGNRAKVTVTVDAKDIDDRIKKTYKDFAYKYNFPGFRKGKAPRPVIDNALGKDTVLATVTDEVVNGFYPLAIDDCDLYPVSKPEFNENMDLVETGRPYVFTFSISVKPELELTGYDPVEIELPAEGATDQDIDEQIEALREHYYTLENAAAATKVKEKSFVDLAIKATNEQGAEIASLTTDSRLYNLGSDVFPDEFDRHLMGLKKGQDASFDLVVTPNSPLAFSALQGSAGRISFEVKINVLKKKVLPEVTDEWVKDTLGFETANDLRTNIADSIIQQKANIIPRLKENACLDALGKRLEADIPESMCEDNESNLIQDFFRQLQAQNMTFDAYLSQQNLTSDQFKADVKQQAADVTRQDLALDAWARHFDIKVTDEDLVEEFAKSGAEDPQALQEEWRANGQLYMVRQGILRMKAVQDLMGSAVVTESDTSAKAKKKPAKKTTPRKKEPAQKADTSQNVE